MALIEVAGQTVEDLNEVRTARAEAQREAARAEAQREYADAVRARTALTPEAPGASSPEQAKGETQQAVAAAQVAAVLGEPSGRGSFVNLAV